MAFGTTLVFDVLTKDHASRTLDSIDKKSRGLGKTLGNLAGIAAGVAVVGGVTMLTGFIKDAQEAAKIGRITTQVIKSTGGAAKISAKQVDDLSEALSNKTAVDDELIQTGANLLLTFKNIRNEAGKGNDIFNQATAAALDLSAAGFGSVESAAKMLGKALNDPLAGLTALGRAGVTFTAEQKKQIQTLVETGDILAAQRIIMEEIASQVGGAAEAAASPWDKLKTIVANLGEEIGAVLLPHLEDFATWMIDKGVPRVEDMIAAFRDDWIPAIKDLWGQFEDHVLPVLKKFWGWIDDTINSIPDLLSAYALWTAAQWGLNAAMAANPIGAVIAAIALLVAIGIQVAENWDVITLGFKEMWRRIKLIAIDGVKFIINIWFEMAEGVLDAAEAMLGWVPGLGDKLRNAQTRFNEFRDGVNGALDGIKNRQINTNILFTSNAAKFTGSVRSLTKGMATGGPVFGSGGPTSDSVMAWLSPGEHVWTAKEVQAFGGHKAMELARKHTARGFATGGPVELNVAAAAPRIRADAFKGVDMAITDYTTTTARRTAEMIRDIMVKRLNALTPALPSGVTAGPGGRVFPLPRGTYRWGQGPAGHGYDAQDLPVPTGTRVFAPVSGFARGINLGNRSYGNYINMSGGGFSRIILAHLSRLLVSAMGRSVRAGEVVGLSGSTGNSTGPHLHVEPSRILRFDKGGVLPTGASLVVNNTGQPEKVIPAGQPMRLHPADIKAIGRVIAAEMAATVGAGAYAAGQRADLMARAG